MKRNGKQEAAAKDQEEFSSFFPKIVKDLIDDELRCPDVDDAFVRLKEMVEYNTIGGKCNRGLTVVSAFRHLAKPGQQDQENADRAKVVGWAVELLQAFFLVADDIMDHSIMRRGKPCWYTKEGIALDAVNDVLMLESSIYRLLKRHCRDQPYYLNLLELFLEASYQTELGQTLDLMTASPLRVDLSRFTEDRYKAIVKYKTAYYSFCLPVAAAMYMAGIDGKEEHARARAILLEMGQFFQIQDDFLDCFGDPAVTGKIGTDIQDNKCSWLVVQCLKRGSAEQRRLLEENYGQNDMDKVACVKQLYEKLDMKAIFHEYEESSFARLMSLVNEQAGSLPKEIFLELAHHVYKRQK